jgi:hypothetical protein
MLEARGCRVTAAGSRRIAMDLRSRTSASDPLRADVALPELSSFDIMHVNREISRAPRVLYTRRPKD